MFDNNEIRWVYLSVANLASFVPILPLHITTGYRYSDDVLMLNDTL